MKSIAIICLLMLTLSVHAQIGKGKNVLSGNINFLSSSNSTSLSSQKTNYSSLDIMPRYGYLFGEKTEVGISIGYSWRKEENNGDPLYAYGGKNTTGLFLVEPYVRLYQNLAERFYFNFSFVTTFFTGSREYTSEYIYSQKTEYSIFEYKAGIAPGLVYFFNNHWATNISLGVLQYDSYKSTNKETDNSTTNNTVTAGLNAGGLNFGIGLYF